MWLIRKAGLGKTVCRAHFVLYANSQALLWSVSLELLLFYVNTASSDSNQAYQLSKEVADLEDSRHSSASTGDPQSRRTVRAKCRKIPKPLTRLMNHACLTTLDVFSHFNHEPVRCVPVSNVFILAALYVERRLAVVSTTAHGFPSCAAGRKREERASLVLQKSASG